MTAYLDHAATSPIRPEVLEEMLPVLRSGLGNPSSIHAAGRAARKALDDARDRVAAALRCDPKEIVFTSGATEANHLAVLGAARARPGRALVAGTTEHACVRESLAAAGREGCRVIRVAPGEDGRIAPDSVPVEGAGLVSLMMVNNETGAVGPVAEVGYRAREAGAWMHTDAVQALGKYPIDLSVLPVDLLTLSSHKVGGPAGAGLLFVREGTDIEPLLRGGGQEFGLRAGTENVAAAVGFAKAVELAVGETRKEAVRLSRLTTRLLYGLRERGPGVKLNGPLDERAPHIVNVSFEGVNGEALAMALDAEGVRVSTGSACASLSTEASHVLRAMGLDSSRIRGSIRFSVGWSSTEEEIDEVLSKLPGVLARLRRD